MKLSKIYPLSLEETIKKSWESPVEVSGGVARWNEKIRRLRKTLRKWARSEFGKFKQNKESLVSKIQALEILEETRDLNGDERDDIAVSRVELDHIYSMEECYWKQRPRDQWLKEGDAKTAYFHKLANRKRANTILGLFDGNEWIPRGEKLHEHIDATFKGLLGTRRSFRCPVKENFWEKNEQLDFSSLEVKFSDEETKEAIRRLGQDKSPGPDGFPMFFYSHFWDIVRADFLTILDEFFDGSATIERLNFVSVVLIPKNGDIQRVTDLRPISLLNCSFKIISNVLATRLSRILPLEVHEAQRGFVKGREIADSIGMANEVIFHCQWQKEVGFLLKLDFEKAYDIVDWECVLETLKGKGFGDRWIRWMDLCIKGGNSTVWVNGEPGNLITCRRGLRQRDPLSPLLFTLVADGLTKMVQRCLKKGLLKGIGGMGQRGGDTSILQYADDTLIFGKADIREVFVIKGILQCFEGWSGLKVNYHKSNLIPLGACTWEIGRCLAGLLGCECESFPLKYLGVPIRARKLHKEDWIPLIENIEKRLAGWK